MSNDEWDEEQASNQMIGRGEALAEADGIAAFDKLIGLINNLEVTLLHAPTRQAGDDERATIAHFAATHRHGGNLIHEVATRDWAEDGAPTLLAAWQRNVEAGVLEWAHAEMPEAARDYVRGHFSDASPIDAVDRATLWRFLADSYCDTGKHLALLGHRQREPMSVARRWASELASVDARLADPRDLPALSNYLQQAQAAGYHPMTHVRSALQDPRPLSERPAQTLMYRLAGSFDQQRMAEALGAQWVAQQLDDAGIDLPGGYRLAESGVPGVAPKYQVLRDTGRDEQFIGMRDSREEATGMAHLHHSRLQAERAIATHRRAPIPPPAPQR